AAPGHVGHSDNRHQAAGIAHGVDCGPSRLSPPALIGVGEAAMSTIAQAAALGPHRIAAPPAAQTDKASTTAWIAVLASMVGAFMAILNIQITNASLLDIEGGIGTGVDNGAWISTSYLIGEIVVIPLTDYLSKVFSFRRYII